MFRDVRALLSESCLEVIYYLTSQKGNGFECASQQCLIKVIEIFRASEPAGQSITFMFSNSRNCLHTRGAFRRALSNLNFSASLTAEAYGCSKGLQFFITAHQFGYVSWSKAAQVQATGKERNPISHPTPHSPTSTIL